MAKNVRRAEDIQLIVGGNFTPDSLGPEVYNNVVARVQADPDGYLDQFEMQFLGQNFDALTQSRLHIPTFLRLLADVAPDRVKDVSDRLLQQYNAVLVIYDSTDDKQALARIIPEETWHLSQRLYRRRLELQSLTH